MIPTLQPIAALLRTTDMILPVALSELKETDATYRSRKGEGPSMTWHVGHMLHHRSVILKLLGSGKESPYAATFGVTGATDGSDYASLAHYREEWDRVSGEVSAALESAKEGDLTKALKSVHGETVMDSIVFHVWHESYHVGALVATRKELGYAGPAEIFMARAMAG